ncbi:uncharacterized protein LOC125229036 isoform X1 [Leguminivora glycinivorella]|uniref:uncharacterized protein LOC125229036 isoform X1 n=1 Tax=Leguminivora glycinivorella TaxID=1035111 RepID=UPI00200EB0C9|nr:uncharacterized protein LOC125229036 isoform X1 [Leguminivora glycinivorella]
MRNSGIILFMCAGLLLSGGAILGGSTAWSLLRMSYYFWTSDLAVELASTVSFVAGALLCLPVCWLATLVPYYPRSQPLFATLLGVTMTALLMLTVGQCSLGGLARALREPGALNASMHRALSLQGVDAAMRTSVAAMQLELRCCGVQDPSDWYKHRRTLPPSCCGRISNFKREAVCDLSQLPSPQTGCLRLAILELRNYASALTALSSAIIMILAVTVFTAAYTTASGVVERQKTPVRVAYLTAPPAPLACYPQNLSPPAPALPAVP